jgi:hypothetical protein
MDLTSLADTNHMNRRQISHLLLPALVLAGLLGGAFPAHSASGSSGVRASVTSQRSGVAMPTARVPGFRGVFTDDFRGSTLDPSRWRTKAGPAERRPCLLVRPDPRVGLER